MQIIAIVSMVSALIGFSAGYVFEHRAFLAYQAQERAESDRVALAAVRYADLKAIELSSAKNEIEVNASEAKSKIDAAHADNRRLAAALSMRPRCPVRPGTMPASSKPAGIDHATADNGLAGACPEAVTTMARDADANASLALACQSWVNHITNAMRPQHE